ncbi:MAG: hypothetical protein M9921_03455 [Fimbriimonadaceae bacterium]|nr:hypothetical protein [Chthonomonadaceae bacterium]MCO5295892.1 hypothetical protein [Fimbriimonadaceae bacterium]
MPRNRHPRNKRRGAALATTFLVMTLLAVATSSYIGSATTSVRLSKKMTTEAQTTHLCEAGIQSVLRDLWRPFKVTQTFTQMEAACTGASEGSPMVAVASDIPGVGRFAAGVVSFTNPGDPYRRQVVVRSVGWLDLNNNGQLDAGEPRKTVDAGTEFQLSRSQVFDYVYFVNNYGWMDGFQPTWLTVNGDMRANGNFSILNGSPTINGSLVAANNDKLIPGAAGVVNTPPVKWSDSTYQANAASQQWWRQAYNPAVHGAKGSSTYEQWRDFIFESDGTIVNNRISGAAIMDATGKRAWQRPNTGAATTTMLDVSPTEEVVMPDLSDLEYYQNISTNYVDSKATYGDGSANPFAGQGAWVKVWNTSTSTYDTVTSAGNLDGSAVLVGTSAHPVLIHGPVTFTQDCVIKGYVQGQGTIYAGRNVHVVGSVRYKTPPDFRGSDMQAIDNANEKKDMLALAARGSVMMGNPNSFGNPYPLAYMTPPFTKPRLDDYGNVIPAFNALQIDASGKPRYKSVIPDATMNSIAEGVNQIDAVLYTNFVGGGNIGTGGGGVKFNGTLISKDEAMVVFSIPMEMNYDSRIRERTLTAQPLIDLALPRSPVLLRSTWHDRGLTQY